MNVNIFFHVICEGKYYLGYTSKWKYIVIYSGLSMLVSVLFKPSNWCYSPVS